MEVHGRAELFKCVAPGCRYAHAESIRGASLHLVAADPASAASDGPACHAGPTPPTTVVGELPQCPACGAPSLPQALLFDEEYESHSYYQYRKARRWLASATCALVRVAIGSPGCSVSPSCTCSFATCIFGAGGA